MGYIFLLHGQQPILDNWGSPLKKAAAEWSSGRIPACCSGGPGFRPWVEGPIIFKIGFHQQKLSSQLTAYNVKLEGAVYSVLYAETSKRP